MFGDLFQIIGFQTLKGHTGNHYKNDMTNLSHLNF